MTDRERLLDKLRPVSFATADRMLSSISNAEDVVQEALLRLHQALQAGEQIASPRAFVAAVTTRLAINELRSARPLRTRALSTAPPRSVQERARPPVRGVEAPGPGRVATMTMSLGLTPEATVTAPRTGQRRSGTACTLRSATSRPAQEAP
jgi:DNA-directed RNA polymerase specialized sigma24 family protein